MDILLYACIALIIGAIIGYLIAKQASNAKINSVKDELHATQQKEGIANKQLELLQAEAMTSKAEIEKLRAELSFKTAEIATLISEKSSIDKQLNQHAEDLKEMKAGFQKEFENLANKIFDEKSEKFTLQNKNSLDRIIDPLKERIADFQKKVEDTHNSSLKENSSLRQELKHLQQMSQRMTDKAEGLTNALKNDNKTQGNWGEMILENILESSGLEKDRNYFTQQSYNTGEGRRLQPDVMIKLPEDKWVVIDSKVSLNAYERFVNESDETLKTDALKAHMLSIRQHFKGLSGKGYNELADGKNLDFILMFVPIEPAYLIALHGDQSLFNEAFEKGIVMVSPSTLIASLKIIASTWKHEYQNRNALDIANRGKLLLEKFIGFTEDFLKIGEQLTRSDKAYQDALKKLRDGKGSLVTQAQQLEELGVKTSKKIDSNLTQDEA